MRTFIAMVLFCFLFAVNSYASDPPPAAGDAYFDIATGHKYIKNPDATYTEFSQKGVLLRDSVPNDLPLLTTNKYIREISRDSYLLYERKNKGVNESTLLAIHQAHPHGWKCKQVLIPIE